MPKEKQRANWKQCLLVGFAVVVAGIGCLIHMAHKEYSSTSERSIGSRAFTSTYIDAAPVIDHSEKFSATAYCLSGITKSGTKTVPGLVSADPKVIPLGSMIYVETPFFSGVYQVLDTGELVKGKIIDIFVPSYERCVEFGRRIVKVKVLRYGFQDKPLENKKKANR
jgi:3D (Asp-Asp-Asp) domain-containing protein